MKRRLRRAMAVALAIVGLALGACQAPPAAIAPTNAPAQAREVPPATPAPTGTSQPTPAANSFQSLWVFPTQGPIWGTATVAGGTVYFGSDDESLYALEAKSGQLKWKFPTQGIVRSRPAVAGGVVYFASDDGYLYAVDVQSGQQVWQTDIGNAVPRAVREKLGGLNPTNYDYLQSSPVVSHGQVYVGSLDGNVYSVSADTGRITWAYDTGGQVRATPTVHSDTVYIGSWSKWVYALNARSGEERWKTPVGGQVQTTAIVAGGLVYCASRKASVVALDAESGRMKWEYDYGANMWVESSPRLVNGTVYIGSSASKMVVGLDGKTGQIFTILTTSAFYWSTPLIVGDTLYIGATGASPADRGGLMAIKLVDGKFSRIEGDARYLPVEKTLEASGTWRGVASSPVAEGGVIYFGGLDGRLYAVAG